MSRVTNRFARVLIALGLGTGVFVILLSLTLGGFAYAYQNKVYPGVSFNQTSLAGKTETEAQAYLIRQNERLLQKKVVVAVPDISQPRLESTGHYPILEIPTTAGALGVELETQAVHQAIWQIGHGRNLWTWLKQVTQSSFREINIPAQIQLDDQAILAFINTEVVKTIPLPIPARLTVDGTKIVITDPKPGLSVETTQLSQQLRATLLDSLYDDDTYVRAPVAVTESVITRESLANAAAQLDKLGQLSLTLTNNDQTMRPSRAELLQWFELVQDEVGIVNIAVNSDPVAAYLKAKGGTTLDQKKALTQIIDSLSQALAESTKVAGQLSGRSLALAQKPPPTTKEVTAGEYTLGRFEGRYLEINLKEQKLYRIDGNNLEKVYRVSTGKWSTPTPKGIFTITGKHTRAYSRTYGLYMPYWMNFMGTPDGSDQELKAGSYGIHELPEWPSGYKEGAAHIGTAVSHGCVRLGVGDAAEVYAWTETGTPIVVF